MKFPNNYILIFIFLMVSCHSNGPEPIDIHKDRCEFCKMSISDIRFACELKTSKGRVYKFDDVLCVNGYLHANPDKADGKIWVSDFEDGNVLLPVDKAYYIESDSLRSPMGGDVAAFKTQSNADEYAEKYGARRILWENVKEK